MGLALAEAAPAAESEAAACDGGSATGGSGSGARCGALCACGSAAGAGAPAAAGQSEVVQNDPDWRFDGVTVNGAERRVLVRVAGQAATALKEGDALPGGAKILHIHDDSLCLLINGKKRNLDIFQ